MKKSRLISPELVHSINVMNTLGGGVSQPIVELMQFQDHREIKCRVPGVESTLLQVELVNNFLSIFFTQAIDSDSEHIQVPKIVYHKAVPYFVDIAMITASLTDGFLCVTLPFNELADGYRKKISVQN